ncbi:MAG: TrkH family potassium uptake protein [Gammaproteobacteria bacterium]
MRLRNIQYVLGLLLVLFAGTLLVPLGVSLIYHDEAMRAFLLAFVVILAIGLFLWLPLVHYQFDLKRREGFAIVALFWVGIGIAGAVPLVLAEHPQITLTDALFESVSALTTTGATVLVGIDLLPPSILWYRMQLQWLGGMGVIVLAIAVLPMLGVGGMQLYRAEVPGPMKDSRLTPRLAETAKGLWTIYVVLTVICAVAYWLAGMNAFDALGHAFSTVSTGGMSHHDASLGYFQSPAIETIAVLFMFLGATNFALHFEAWRRRSIRSYLNDPEFRVFLVLYLVIAAVVTLHLYHSDTFNSVEADLLHGAFHVYSIGTSTGFTTADYYNWPGFLPVLLLFASFVGGCAGSTGGGLKVLRIMLLAKQGRRGMKALVYPRAILPIKYGRQILNPATIDSVWSFFAAYVAVFSIIMLALMADGQDQITAFSAVAACINNMGPGLGAVAANYATLSDFAKSVLTMAMLLGRLEIFTLLVLLTPEFWSG